MMKVDSTQDMGRRNSGTMPGNSTEIASDVDARRPVSVFVMMSPRLRRYLVPGFCVLVVYGTLQASSQLAQQRAVGAWAATVIFVGAFLAVGRRQARSQADGIADAGLVLAMGLAGIALQLVGPLASSFGLVAAALVTAGVRLNDAMGRSVAGALGAGYVASVISTHQTSQAGIVSLSAGLVFAYLAAAGVRQLRMEQRKTEALLEQVVAGRDAEIRAAQLDERAELAREVHDVLAHTLSGLSIQLEGARMLVAQRPTDPAALQAVERSSQLAREGLTEARRAVGSLRGELATDLNPQRLAEEFERTTGIPCRMQVEGTKAELRPDVRLALYRTVQEGLTNARKHADTTQVDISFRYGPDTVELVVENEATARRSPAESGGYGLVGMRERAELLGGGLEAGPTSKGYRVRVWIPL